MKRIFLASLISIQAYNCFGADIKKFSEYANDAYQITMEDRFDLAEITEPNFNLTITNIDDFRCPPSITTSRYDEGVTIYGQLNKVNFALKYKDNKKKKDTIKASGFELKFNHMLGGFEEEPYVFELRIRKIK